jgi:transcriptional regulator with XRE-family HTH domain
MTKGERIRFFRTQKGLTLEELAQQIKMATQNNLTRQTLSRYETGVISNIPSDQLSAIADALAVSPATLLGWHPEWRPDFNSARSKEEKLMLLKMWGIPKDLSCYESDLYKDADVILADSSVASHKVLSKNESKLVDTYRSVTEQGQQEMMAHADYIGERYKKNPSASADKAM